MAEKSSKQTRTRAPNFSKEDQLLLFDYIKPYVHIIECKQTDGVKQSDKQNAWAKITEVFNANTSNLHRTSENLISCYRNVKSKIKKQHSEAKMLLRNPMHRNALVSAIEENGKNWEEVAVTVNQPKELCQKGFEELVKECKKEENKAKKAIMGTGGGPPNLLKEDDPLSSIKKLIEPQIDGLYTIYDNDTELMSQYQLSLPVEERIKPIEEETISKSTLDIGPESTTNIENTMNIDKTPIFNTPVQSRVQILRKKKEDALSTHRGNKPKSTVSQSFQKLSEAKLELVQLQKKYLEMEMEQKKKMWEKKLLLLDLKIKHESSK